MAVNRILASATVTMLAPLLAACSSTPAPANQPSVTPALPSLSPAPTATPANGTKISGDGYSYRVPRDWRNLGTMMKSTGADTTAAANRPAGGFTSNVNVVIVNETFARSQTQAIAEKARDKVGAGSPGYKVLADTTIAGSLAAHLGGPHTTKGTTYWLEQYLITHGTHTYVVSFTFSTKVSRARRTQTLGSILASWAWA